MENFQLTAVFEEGGYIAYLAEMDGLNTQGETIEEAKENPLDAFNLMKTQYTEIKDRLAVKICKDLDIPSIK